MAELVLSFSFSRRPRLRLFKRILTSYGYAARGDDFRFTWRPVPMVISARVDGSALFGMWFQDRDRMSRFIEGFCDAFPALPVETHRKNIIVIRGSKDDVTTAVWEAVLEPLEIAEFNAQFDDIIQREFGPAS